MVAEVNCEAIIADHVSCICMGSDYCSTRNIIYSIELNLVVTGKEQLDGDKQ